MASNFEARAADQGNEEPGVSARPERESQEDPVEVRIYLKDGQRLTGILVDAGREVLQVRIAGIVTPLAMELVEKYEVLPPIGERYLELRKAVGNDAEQIVQLAQWLREREKYELALAEVLRALEIDPAMPLAKTLKVQLEQQILLKIKQKESAEPEREPKKSKPVADKVESRVDFPLLTREQINLLKVYEIDLKSKPRLVIPRETITKMLEQNAGHPLVPITREGREAIYRKNPAEILEMMFKLQSRTLYRDVQVLDQPEVFERFRDEIQRTWLLPRCSTSDCHGGSEAGRLMLMTQRPNSEQTVYTNFLIVSRFKLSDGTPLVNVDEPSKSPLLQIGLHPEDSTYPHPEVKNDKGRDLFKPVFRWTDDPQFVEGVEWIKKLFRPRPEYPIEYTLPVGKSPEKADVKGSRAGEDESNGADNTRQTGEPDSR